MLGGDDGLTLVAPVLVKLDPDQLFDTKSWEGPGASFVEDSLSSLRFRTNADGFVGFHSCR